MKSRSLFSHVLACGLGALWFAAPALRAADTLQFAGYTWNIRPGGRGGPGPNEWAPANAWVDKEGYLHLKLSQRDGKWYCAEVYAQQKFGFGTYTFSIDGPIDKLAPSIVVGLFTYPTPDFGKDGQDEIDIEFSRWGNPENNKIDGFTVWPAKRGVHNGSKAFALPLTGSLSNHQFIWSPASIHFTSSLPDGTTLADWHFQPANPQIAIAQAPQEFHFNIWLYKGTPPADGKELEVVIRSFKFQPL